MKNLLINMSRKRSLMVPVVTLMALSIGIGGYYVQDKRIASRQDSQPQTAGSQDSSLEADLKKYDNVQPETKDDSLSPEEDKSSSDDIVSVTMQLSLKQVDDKYILSSASDTDKPGTCKVMFSQGDITKSPEVKTENGTCEVELPIMRERDYTLTVDYQSDDGTTKASASSTSGL